jgi:hypothetical protein
MIDLKPASIGPCYSQYGPSGGAYLSRGHLVQQPISGTPECSDDDDIGG